MSPPILHRRPLYRCLTGAALSWPLLAACSETVATAAAPPGVSWSTMLQTFAALALILGLFVGAAWLARRINGGNPMLGGNSPLRLVSALTIGPRERIVLLEIEDTWLVVGVAPGHIRTLHTMPKGELPTTNGAEGQFGHWLKQFREQRNEQKQ